MNMIVGGIDIDEQTDIQVQYQPRLKAGEVPKGCWIFFRSDCNNGRAGEGGVWLEQKHIDELISLLKKSALPRTHGNGDEE